MQPQQTDLLQRNTKFTVITLAMCFLVALLEGFDIQSMGVVAPFVKAQFALSTGELAWVFSAATLGMFPGAVVGGRLADKYGRKRVLLVSVAIFGLMSLATAYCTTFTEFVAARFLTGVGMGAALPLMIAIASESVSEKHNGTAVSIMYAGVPLGAAVTALMARNFSSPTEWIHIFYLGGIGPIVILPLLQIFLKETIKISPQKAINPQPFKEVLFANNRFAATLQVWVSFFCTLIVLYFILNWLPILMKANGLENKQVSMIQLMYQVGAAIGTLILGQILDRINIRWVVILIYTGILAGLICLSMSTDYGFLVFAAALCGFFLTGGAVSSVCVGSFGLPKCNTGHRYRFSRCGRTDWFFCRSFIGRLYFIHEFKLVYGDWGKYSCHCDSSRSSIIACDKFRQK